MAVKNSKMHPGRHPRLQHSCSELFLSQKGDPFYSIQHLVENIKENVITWKVKVALMLLGNPPAH